MMELDVPSTEQDRDRRKVSLLVLVRVFARSFLIQAGFNPKAMQGLGFAYTVYPALKQLYPAGEARTAAVRRHLGLFNTHPYFAAAVVGGVVRLEERVASDLAPPEAVLAFRSALGAPLAAIGDAFFWNALRPACALLAVLTVPSIGLGAVWVFLGLYNAVHLSARAWLFVIGYRRAEGLIPVIGGAHFPVGTAFLQRAAAALAGAVAAQLTIVSGRRMGPLAAAATGGAALLGVLLAGRVNSYLVVIVALLLSLAAGLVW